MQLVSRGEIFKRRSFKRGEKGKKGIFCFSGAKIASERKEEKSAWGRAKKGKKKKRKRRAKKEEEIEREPPNIRVLSLSEREDGEGGRSRETAANQIRYIT